jgi:hypothetical protein
MGATFDLTLDTRAPVVTWGAVGGATAGELLEVLYTTDEPLAFAKLWLPDGRKLDMTIEADRLSVLLPADTPNGVSWIHASDDVLNEAPRQAVNIAGVIIVPPPEPPQVPGSSRNSYAALTLAWRRPIARIDKSLAAPSPDGGDLNFTIHDP